MDSARGVGSLQVTENDVLSHSCDLFKPLTREISILEGKEIFVQAGNGQTSRGPYTFEIPTQGEAYINLASAQLWGMCRIVIGNPDQTFKEITEADNVSIVNLFPASLFRDIKVEVNSHPLNELSSPHAHIKTYIEHLLTFSSDALHSHLQSQLFVPDSAEQFDNFGDTNDGFKVPDADAERPHNWGYHDRKLIIAGSRKFDFQIPLSHDFIQADRLLIPGTEVKIELSRADDTFSILSPTKNKQYAVKIDQLRLSVRIVQVAAAVQKYHREKLFKEPCIYPINRTQIKNYNVNKDQSLVDIWNLYASSSRLPKHIIIAMVETSSMNSYSKNPFNFQHFGMDYCVLKVNSTMVPLEPYVPDFENGLFTREYLALFHNTGIHQNDNTGNIITKHLFRGGMFLQAFDLSPCLCNGYHNHAPTVGSIGLTMRFSEPLAQSVTLYVMGTYDAEVYMDRDHQVATDFNIA